MFKKILIANRGEIACRVIRTAKELGIQTVAVYSEADAEAQHVKQADEAICIGRAPASESYLQIERIIEAALLTGAEAIHPGYGFLSENDDFALACQQNGIEFIGPPVEAIRAMGLKATSKALMEEAGVPLTPGYHDKNQEPDFLKQQADAIGYPVLIKASAGGGGKGMRLVECSEDFLSSLTSCKSEARSSFGNEDVLIERYVTRPRHIEVQIFGDKHGNYVHLFERDCSVQRRHQKVLEEAPAPLMPEEKLKAMRQAAIDAARAVNYVGAGTVEFIVEQDGTAYFMEMNTRLQVEHPVTEMITGQDLVEWQLRVAYGEPLPKAQADLSIQGHALEARIYAEDPDNGFLPSIGKIHFLQYPQQNAHVRVDSGIIQGDSISSFYDPMIAKLIVWGKTRQDALRQMQHALQNFYIQGVGNNVAFLHRLVGTGSFSQPNLDTGLIERENIQLFSSKPEIKPSLLAQAAVLHLLQQTLKHSLPHDPWQQPNFWRLNQQAKTHVQLRHQQEIYDIELAILKQGYLVKVYNQDYKISGELTASNTAHLQIDNHQHKLCFVKCDSSLVLFEQAQPYEFEIIDPYAHVEGEAEEAGNLKAPMPGIITQVLVEQFAQVKKDEPLMTLEAMKIEYTIRAPQDGIINNLFFQSGDQVAAGDELLDFCIEAEASA